MQVRKHAAVALAATAAAVGSMAIGATAAHAAAPKPYHVVTIHVNNQRIVVGKDNVIGAGRTLFHVVTHKGDHQINVVRLRKGYTPPQFGQDVGAAFSGNKKAIRRLDRKSVFRGGAESRPGWSNSFSANLGPNLYYFFDSNTNKFTPVKVVGKMSPRTAVPTSSLINIFTYGFAPGARPVRHNGMTLLKNRADQPHFIEFQRVKSGTKPTQVKRFLKKGGQGNPSWALRATEGSGVISPGKTSAMSLNLPKGEYLVACFWPDRMTGMPHFFMGMWKLIQLK